MAKRYIPEMEGRKLKALFYGDPGSTKTRTSATAALDPRTAPVLMLNSGGNPVSLNDYEILPDIVTVDSLEEYNPIYEWLAAGQPVDAKIVKTLELNPPYKTLVVDSITEVQRMSFNHVTGNKSKGPGDIPGRVERQHFGSVLAQMVYFARLFLSLDMHVILTSLERRLENQVTGGVTHGPLIWGQSASEIAGYAYLVGRLVHRAKTEKKVLKVMGDSINNDTVSVALFKPSGNYVAKDQYGMGVNYMADPTITKILDLIDRKQPQTTNPIKETN